MTVATLRYKGMTLELQVNGTWKCDNEIFQTYLNSAFNPKVYPPTPSAGIWDVLDQARAASYRLGVPIEITPTPQQPPPEDRVY